MDATTTSSTHLSDKALLVHLSVSQWIAKKLDRAASQEVAKANHADVRAGRYNKSLLPTSQHLDDVKAKTSMIRKKFYSNTLPWGIEGTYILPSANYLTFMTDFRKEKGEWEYLVEQFLTDYPRARSDASRLLGSLYNASDYPDVSVLRYKFAMDMTVLPVPSGGDFRVELVDEEYDAIRADIEQRVADAQLVAMRDVWQRLYDRVQKYVERLSDPKNIFHNTMIESASETCELLTRLNFTDDPNLEAMRSEVEQKLTAYHPDAIRNDPDLRADVAKEAQSIMDKMGVFMQGFNSLPPAPTNTDEGEDDDA